MSKLEIINSHIPICPECKSGMKIELETMTIRCYCCKEVYHIIDLGKTDKDFVCEVRK